MAVFGGPPARGGQALFPGDVEVGPDHAELLQLLDTVGVHVPAGEEAAGVGGPLAQREVRERGRPPDSFRLFAFGHAVRERHP